MINHAGMDQHGNLYLNLGKHPRAELLRRLNRKRANKMFIGEGRHIGWIIAGCWIEVVRVEPLCPAT